MNGLMNTTTGGMKNQEQKRHLIITERLNVNPSTDGLK